MAYSINDRSTRTSCLCNVAQGSLFIIGEYMESRNLKTPLSFDDQLLHLKKKKLIILNEANALTILKHENYYRLSGYMIDFLDDHDIFKTGTTFEEIYNIYKTDKEIRSILFELINDIDEYLKTNS